MKIIKILTLIMAVLMLAFPLASCNNGGKEGNVTTAETAADVTIKVTMKVKDLSGKVVYDIPSYTYNGKAPTLIDIIDDYFYMETENETVEIDDTNDIRTIISIGSVSAGDVTGTTGGSDETTVLYTTYWWYSLNGKEGTKGFDDYTVQNGDVIEYYLKKVTPETAKK